MAGDYSHCRGFRRSGRVACRAARVEGRNHATGLTASRSITTSVWLSSAASIATRLRSSSAHKSRVEMFPVLTVDPAPRTKPVQPLPETENND